MALLILKSTDAGAPTLNGVNGTLCAVLDWALVQKSWAIEFTATNARVYRAGSGNRRRLAVRHDSAISGAANKATVRGCESASSATAYTDPFPTVAQIANANSKWMTSMTADSTARAWEIYLETTFFYICINSAGGAGRVMYFFGDVPSAESGDTWNTMIWQDAVGSIDMSFAPLWQAPYTAINIVTPSKMHWCRNIDGTVKSIPTHLITSNGGGYLGNAGTLPIAREGYNSKLHYEKLAVTCPGAQASVSANKSIYRRGWMPNLWAPLHNGRGVINVTADRDTFTNTAYNGSALFRVIGTYEPDTYAYPWVIFEETSTWSAP